MPVTLWNKQTGAARSYDTVDAREILEHSPELYTDVDPNPGAVAAVPQNVGAAEEYRREAVGEQTPEAERSEDILRNPTGAPRPAHGVVASHDHFVRPKPAVTGLRDNQ